MSGVIVSHVLGRSSSGGATMTMHDSAYDTQEHIVTGIRFRCLAEYRNQRKENGAPGQHQHAGRNNSGNRNPDDTPRPGLMVFYLNTKVLSVVLCCVAGSD